MRQSFTLYRNPQRPLTNLVKNYYPGIRDEDDYLIVEFLNRKVFKIWSCDSKQTIPGQLIDLTKINKLEIQYLEEKFQGREYEDYSKPVIEYLYTTSRLTKNDYDYFNRRLKRTLETVKTIDSYGYFYSYLKDIGADKHHDSLIFLSVDNTITEVYSGVNAEDEYRYETIQDRKLLDLKLMSNEIIQKFTEYIIISN